MVKLLTLILAALTLCACGAGSSPEAPGAANPTRPKEEEASPREATLPQPGTEMPALQITVGDQVLWATWAANSSA